MCPAASTIASMGTPSGELRYAQKLPPVLMLLLLLLLLCARLKNCMARRALPYTAPSLE